MTETIAVERDRWGPFLDQLSEDHRGELLTVELLGQDFGHQVEAARLTFAVASFDPRNDMVIITAVGQTEDEPVLRHMIRHPSAIDIALPQPDETVLRVVAPTNTTLAHLYPKPGRG